MFVAPILRKHEIFFMQYLKVNTVTATGKLAFRTGDANKTLHRMSYRHLLSQEYIIHWNNSFKKKLSLYPDDLKL